MLKILYSIKSLKNFLKKEKPSSVYVITSQPLSRKLRWVIKEIGVSKNNVILIPDGEKAKEWKELEKLLGKFIGLNINRTSIVVALGGGTVGDVVGFAASVYLRGIKYIQVPTTLLAQSDSSHGAKTGINFHGYKNQVGTLYAPLTTVVDIRLLKTLSQEQVIDGLGEIIKAGFIKDPSILSLLKKEQISTLIKSHRLASIIKKTIAVKQFYISKDPYEQNIRKILNAGHTIGHAIELKYKISHGRAVLIGLSREFAVYEKLGLTPPSLRKYFEALLKQLGITLDFRLRIDWKSVLHDKKVIKNTIMLPVITRVGKSKLVEVNLKLLREILQHH